MPPAVPRIPAGLPMPPIQPPPIATPRPDGPRPRFSVLLPTYEPDGKLVRALESVLSQAGPPEAMEIIVVDDASRADVVRELVEHVDRDRRVAIVEHGQRLGLCGNWNRAIASARGELIHLLHQDDYVLPGFYERMNHGFRQAPGIGMAFCRSRLVDASDRTIRTESRQQWTPGVLTNWLPRIAERQRIQTPAVVVARDTYERLGGYRSDLQLALDWEMWVRIAAHRKVWYDPRPSVCYRRHAANETSRLMASGDAWPDIAHAIEINASHLPSTIRARTKAASIRWYAASAMRTAERQLRQGLFSSAAVTLGHVPGMLALLADEPRSIGIARRLSQLREHVARGLGRRAA